MTKFSNTYGGALYDLAKEEGIEELVLKDLKIFSDTLLTNPDYKKLLTTPFVSKEERKGLIREAWQDSLNRYTINFLCLLCDRDSLAEIFDCEESYRKRFNNEHGITEVVVTTAVQLSDEQRSRLLSAIEKKLGKKLSMIEKIDSSVIGGIKLQAEGTQYDGTTAYHLESIAKMLSGNN